MSDQQSNHVIMRWLIARALRERGAKQGEVGGLAKARKTYRERDREKERQSEREKEKGRKRDRERKSEI